MTIARRAQARFVGVREQRNELMGHYRALTDGIAELKLHAPRRAAFLRDALNRALRGIEALTFEGQSLYTLANGYRQAMFMLAAAPIVFAAPFLDLDRVAATGAVLALFYLRGPMDAVMSAFPTIARADVALRSYRRVLAALPAEQEDDGDERATDDASVAPFDSVEEIALRRVRDVYSGPEGFAIGPIDLMIRAGEILFIAGGNGSGKTTLAKVIAGLYEPSDGSVSIDGMTIDARNRDRYRQLISGVFARFHLFRQLFGVDLLESAGRAREWLQRLDLHREVRIEGGRFSTLDLSTGQRKRMALLVSMIDDRPICLFDEWAAEQDPPYREEFYTRILPELKARGKVVVVITHDDRYFDTGDHLVRMERGQIVWQGRPRDERPIVAATQSVC